MPTPMPMPMNSSRPPLLGLTAAGPVPVPRFEEAPDRRARTRTQNRPPGPYRRRILQVCARLMTRGRA
ncbi:hypothetical protein ABT354_33520 [Streptomyces sp. NPDC000594]|uniref:hypothetical protein n=1 Tax=Streptomyces sp. NPDC000594 TaxID=3154261 RepID=UPI003322D471